MKKYGFLLIALVLVVVVCSCGQNVENQADNSTDIKNIENLPRTEDISEGIVKSSGNYGESYSYSYDFDFDGIKEEISLTLNTPTEDPWYNQTIIVSVGDYTREVSCMGASFEAIYACDIDLDDGVKDFAVITQEMSGDPRLQIFKYDSSLSLYGFLNEAEWLEEPRIEEDNWLGYVNSHYFNVNEDGSITIEEMTPSVGMWTVRKIYYRDKDGVFVEKKPEYYEVLPDFMRESFAKETLTDYEKEMWEQGYMKAGVDYSGKDVTINQNEYFKVLYDDGDSNLYIEKENKESGWINIGSYDSVRYDLNSAFFMLAG